MSAAAERIQGALDMYRMFEGTDRRDEFLGRLRDVVDAVRREHEKARRA